MIRRYLARLLALTAVALIVAAAWSAASAPAAVLYPPRLSPVVRTAERFELKGTVYNYGGTTTYHFEYGTTTAYGTTVPMPDADAGTALATPAVGGSGPKTVAKTVHVKGRTLLTSTAGRTLYSLSAEKHGKFICTEASGCTAIWHPLTVASGVVPKGPVKLGTIKRPEGTIQVTYRGLPLYTFAGDKKRGQVNGEGLKDVGTWHPATVAARTGSGTSPSSPPRGPGTY